MGLESYYATSDARWASTCREPRSSQQPALKQQLAKLALIEASHTRVSAEVMSAVSPAPAADRGNFDRACRRPSGQLHASIHGIVFCLPSMGEGYEPTTYRDVG